MTNELFLVNKRGIKLAVTLSIPDGSVNPPVIFLLQGFLGKKDGTKLNSLSDQLLLNGIATIRFDYSGYGKSEGNAETEYLISNMLKDIDLILDSIKNNSKIDSLRIGVWGQSMGGMLALLTASSHSEIKLVCAVSSPPTITLNDDLENKINEWKEKGYLKRFNSNGNLIKITYKFVEDARKWNAANEVVKIDSPKLFIIGTQDTTVQPNSTIEIFDSAKGIKELLKIDGMPHEYNQNPEFINAVNNASIKFIKKHLS